MKINLITILLSLSFIAFADGDINLTSKAKTYVEFGTFQYGNGAMVTIKGKAAEALFDRVKFENVSDTLSTDIKQTENLQCIKTKKSVECKIFIRENGTVGELPLLYQ